MQNWYMHACTKSKVEPWIWTHLYTFETIINKGFPLFFVVIFFKAVLPTLTCCNVHIHIYVCTYIHTCMYVFFHLFGGEWILGFPFLHITVGGTYFPFLFPLYIYLFIYRLWLQMRIWVFNSTCGTLARKFHQLERKGNEEEDVARSIHFGWRVCESIRIWFL